MAFLEILRKKEKKGTREKEEKGTKREQTLAKNQHPLEKRKEILHCKELTYSKSSLSVKLGAH